MATLPPGPGIPLDVYDRLVIEAHGSTTAGELFLEARLLDVDQNIRRVRIFVTTASDRSVTRQTIPVGPGRLLSVTVVAVIGTVQRGELFVSVFLGRNLPFPAERSFLLLQDYVVGGSGLGWPGGQITDPLGGRGNYRVVALANPAAGAEMSLLVPAGALWRLRHFRWRFVTDATAGNRSVRVIADDGTNIYQRWAATSVQGASGDSRYTGLVGGAPAGITGDNIVALHAEIILPAGHTFRSETFGLAAGDQFSDGFFAIEEWLSN